jgi:hypothetical protein
VLRDTVFRPLEAAGRTGERTIFDRNVRRLTEVMFDPSFERQMVRLRELNPNSPAAARAMTQMLRVTEENE